jgi:O-antigen ligase
VQLIKQNSLLLGICLLYIGLSCYLIWIDQKYLTLAPLGFMAIYFAIFHLEYTFISLAFLAPISINIEEYTEGFGLYIPTEPLLFGILLLVLMQHTLKDKSTSYFWKHPITLALAFYLFWCFITSITSTSPITSFKFLLSKLWFIIPLLLVGAKVFSNLKNVKWFIWLFCLSMCIVIIYTVTVHAGYGFGEKEGHWVMWPFFKDHTIYGSTIAFIIPLVFGLYFSKKHTPLTQIFLLSLILISLIGLYLSSTRAAWLSVIVAILILLIIKLRIKFSVIAAITIISATTLFFSWDSILIELERNKYEHTTEEFGEKFQSATNVTTDASNLERLNRWACAIEMFKQKPVFGFGPGTYAFEYARFQDPENLTIISTNFGDRGNVHSEYLGPLSEMGFPGFLAMILIVVAIFYKAITLYYKWPSDDREYKTLLLAMILSLATYFVHGILNNYLDTDKAAVPIWSFCAAFIAMEHVLKTRLNSNEIGPT